jgi:hypothetical protein
MKQSPENRREKILNQLRVTGQLSMEEIVNGYGISLMTANRDVRQMEEERLIRRVRGGIALPSTESHPDICSMCRRPVPERTRFIFSSPTWETQTACCPHCGISQMRDITSTGIFDTDFLYGRLISAHFCTYVAGSQVRLCCSPSVLSFENHDDAVRFQTGFGGEVLNLQQTLRYLTSPGQLNIN